MYGEYIAEREGKFILEDEMGFATYLVNKDEVYIVDIYVKREHRKSGHAKRLADQVCKKCKEEHGVKRVLGSVDIRVKTATESMKVLLAYGMRVHGLQGTLLYFQKEIV